jgi:hypothetical protein
MEANTYKRFVGNARRAMGRTRAHPDGESAGQDWPPQVHDFLSRCMALRRKDPDVARQP